MISDEVTFTLIVEKRSDTDQLVGKYMTKWGFDTNNYDYDISYRPLNATYAFLEATVWAQRKQPWGY